MNTYLFLHYFTSFHIYNDNYELLILIIVFATFFLVRSNPSCHAGTFQLIKTFVVFTERLLTSPPVVTLLLSWLVLPSYELKL